MSKFSAQHYNAIAKDIREELDAAISFHNPGFDSVTRNVADKQYRYYAVEALVNLALRLAKRFSDDNEGFKPLKFLDACSPDVDLYPLSELWEEYSK